MNHRYAKTLSIIALAVALIGCAKLKKSDAEFEREQWIQGFNDSIGFYQQRNEKIESELQEMNDKIADQLSKFDYVKNPREVAGYYLLKGWRGKVPMTSTGVYARLNEREEIELIATLSGGTFNQIGVKDGDETFLSAVVKNDQALNYRHNGYNTVCFSGGKADTIAMVIARHKDNNINLEFIQGGSKRNFSLPQGQKEMIAATYNLIKDKIELSQLQKELWINARKIEAFHKILSEENEKQDSIKSN